MDKVVTGEADLAIAGKPETLPGSVAFSMLENLAEWGVISAAAVGRAFLANPDLVTRLESGAELNEPDVATFYAPGPAGYIDYPTLDELAAAQPA